MESIFTFTITLFQLLQSSSVLSPTITNSTGHYYFVSVPSAIDTYAINCTSNNLCYVQCDADESCSRISLTSLTSPQFDIHCIGFHSCDHSLLQLSTIDHITLNCGNLNSCSNSIIHAESASYFNAFCGGCESSNLFLTTAKQIAIECQSCIDTKIFASNAETVAIVCSGRYKCDSLQIFCPYTATNICNLTCSAVDSCGSNTQIIVPFIQRDTEFLHLIDYKQDSTENELAIHVYCNSETARYSGTFILNDTQTKRIQCSNVTSECCPFTKNRLTLDCVSLARDNSCIINCSSINCVDTDIISTSNVVDELTVICGSNDCYNTVIYCPSTNHSSCDISCDYQPLSCHKTVIIYNDNNQEIDLRCIQAKSCYNLQIFGALHSKSANLMHVSITCNNSLSCAYAQFLFHYNMNQMNLFCTSDDTDTIAMCYNTNLYFYGSVTYYVDVDCTANNLYSSCASMQISSQNVDRLNMFCLSDHSCTDIYIYSNYHTMNATHVLCDSAKDCSNVNIIVPSTKYQPGFLSMSQSADCSAISTKCGNAYITNINADCLCGDNGFMCCPFIKQQNIFYCESSTCIVNCAEMQCDGMLINASLSHDVQLLCDDSCSMIKLFASHAQEIYIRGANAHNISIFAEYAINLHMVCNHCSAIFIDATYASYIIIDVLSLNQFLLHALNATHVSLTCHSSDIAYSCAALTLYLPSNHTSIHCQEFSCGANISIYSYYGLLTLSHLNISSCGNCFSYFGCMVQWDIYCGSTFDQHTVFYGDYCSDNNKLCDCEEYFEEKHEEITDGIDTCGDKHELYQHIVPHAVGIIFAIILFAIIALFLYGICRGYICQCVDKQFKEHEAIRPPNKHMLTYLHWWDLLLFMIQWFIVLRVIYFHTYWVHTCSVYYAPDDKDGVEELCNANIHCSFDTKCNTSRALFVVYVYMICVICVAVFMDMCRLLVILGIAFYDVELNDFRVRLCGDSMCLRIFQMDSLYDRLWSVIIHEYFFKRKMFRYYIHEDSLHILYCIIRYICFFAGALTFYVIWYTEPESLHWYEVIPAIIVSLFNEVLLKPHYILMPPYDEHKHCLFVISRLFEDDQIAVIIMQFVGVNYKESDGNIVKPEGKIKAKDGKQYTSVSNIAD